MDAERIQRDYYRRTAGEYEQRHLGERSAHDEALDRLSMWGRTLGARSVLDVGTGTGRALEVLQRKLPGTRLVGVEPSGDLRAIAAAKELTASVIDGNGESLPFADGEFDLVCEFGILHHVPRPKRVVREMLRVARLAVVISDSNRFGQGSVLARLAKLGLFASGTWPAFDYLRTRGKGYMISDGDGLYYSYSVFDDLDVLEAEAECVEVVGIGSRSMPRLDRFAPLLTSGAVMAVALKADGVQALRSA